MGLILNVFRDASGMDCTRQGISSKFDTFTVVNVSGPFEPTETRPAVMLVQGYGRSLTGRNPMIVEAEQVDGEWRQANPGKRPMHGGNFAWTCDSRFREALTDITNECWHGPVMIMDRFES